MPFLQSKVSGKIEHFNEKLTRDDPMKFMKHAFCRNPDAFLFNATNTIAPKFDNVTKAVNLHFNGLYYDTLTNSSHIQQENTEFVRRHENSHDH